MSKVRENLENTIQHLRSRIGKERAYYASVKDQLDTFYPKQWAVASEAIKTIALYLNGEIVRVKHDLADWMNGHEVVAEYGGSDAIPEIHETIDELINKLEELSNAKPEDQPELADYVSGGMEHIQAMQKALEEDCYAER